MHKPVMLSVLGLVLLAACSQGSPGFPDATASDRAAALAAKPELQDADSQALIARFGQDPLFLANVEQAYGGAAVDLRPGLAQFEVRALDLAADRLAYIKRTSWGNVANYNAQYANQAGVNAVYPGLDWSRDGCSAPDGLGLGYREDFRPPCNVHDFGYRNLKVYERTSANRKTTDEVFLTNMNAVCAAKSWYKRPACYSAAYAYYQAVRVGGGSSF